VAVFFVVIAGGGRGGLVLGTAATMRGGVLMAR